MVLKRRPPEEHGERRSSAGKRRQKARQLEEDLKGTKWEKPVNKKPVKKKRRGKKSWR